MRTTVYMRECIWNATSFLQKGEDKGRYVTYALECLIYYCMAVGVDFDAVLKEAKGAVKEEIAEVANGGRGRPLYEDEQAILR